MNKLLQSFFIGIEMTQLFNKKSEKEKRRYLRTHQTFSEKIVWFNIKQRQICGERFLRQFSVDKFVLDFYCPRLHLGIEIDGDSHFESEEAILYDKEREEFLTSLGIKIIRFTNKEINQNLDRVISKIETKIKELLS
jgi:very-short-patch-repair endonuclease